VNAVAPHRFRWGATAFVVREPQQGAR